MNAHQQLCIVVMIMQPVETHQGHTVVYVKMDLLVMVKLTVLVSVCNLVCISDLENEHA